MALVLFIAIVVVSVGLGIFGARAHGRRWTIASLFVVLVLLANLVQCRPYFVSDPRTWTTTFGSGLITGFIPLFLVTVVPALIACGITRCVARLRPDKVKPKNA